MDIDDEAADGDSDLGDSDSESDLDFELGQEDEWLAFDEGEDRDNIETPEAMLRGLEDMLGPDEETELWDCRASQ